MVSRFDYDFKVSPYSGIVTFRTNLEIYRDKISYFGITKKNENTNEAFFFRSDNYFYDTKLIPIEPTSYDWKISIVNNNCFVSYNGVYGNPFYAIQSIDGGNSWNMLFSYNPASDEYFMGVCPLNEATGLSFIYHDWKETKVFKYSMYGNSQISIIGGYCAYLYKYKNENTIYVVANSSDNVSPSTARDTYLISSFDKGETWGVPICISEELMPENFFYFNDEKMIVSCTDLFHLYNFYYESNDGGNNWIQKSVSNVDKIRSIQFVNQNVGFIKTGKTRSWSEKNYGHVFGTLDGGVTWQQRTTETVLGSRIYFIDQNSGFLQDLEYGKGQILLETNDGGKTWKEVLYPYPIVISQ